MTRTAAARPASSSFRPAAKIVSATSHPRPIMEPAAMPTVVRGSSAATALRLRQSCSAALDEPGAGARGVAEHRQPAEEEDRAARRSAARCRGSGERSSAQRSPKRRITRTMPSTTPANRPTSPSGTGRTHERAQAEADRRAEDDRRHEQAARHRAAHRRRRSRRRAGTAHGRGERGRACGATACRGPILRGLTGARCCPWGPAQ